MRTPPPTVLLALLSAAATSLAIEQTHAHAAPCAPDSVQVGPTCVDKYEASVWLVPGAGASLLRKIQRGRATLADLTRAGATPLGNQCGSPSATFPPNGNWTQPAYALSLPGVVPTSCVSWYQAEQACRLAGKRLLTNQEWQAAAAGTPDPGSDDFTTTCNVQVPTPPEVKPAGSRAACVSRWGAHDMVGNLAEWVADWGDAADIDDEAPTAGCATLPGVQGDDRTCIGGDGTVHVPVAVRRGGHWSSGPEAGVFAYDRADPPIGRSNTAGFRCAR
jgi:formylglycine-generating enzyme required for sulfatase activity